MVIFPHGCSAHTVYLALHELSCGKAHLNTVFIFKRNTSLIYNFLFSFELLAQLKCEDGVGQEGVDEDME